MTTNINNSPEYACRTCAKQECGCKDTECQLPCHFYTEQAEQEPMKECRHCGFLCKPNSNESRKWYPLEQSEHEPVMGYERLNALREGEQNGAEDAYFFVRPENDTPTLRKMFCQGFERGFHKGLKYAAPVRTKDLTDDEERQIIAATVEGVTTSELAMFKAVVRAAIAAYKEKNK